MKKKTLLKELRSYFMITLGSFLYALSISLFLDPNSLAPGGVSGISIILSSVTGVETGTWVFLINIPIIALGLWKFGFKFIVSTIYCVFVSSAFINIVEPYGALTTDPLLAAVAGSALLALGIGLVMKAGGTTGGTDIIVKVLRKRFPHMKTGSLFMMIDACIVTASAIVFENIDRALYAGIAVFFTSTILDLVLYGRDGAKMIYIISDCAEKIAKRLLADVDIGVTYVRGEGAYSGKDKKVILCVMRKPLAPKVEEIVKEEDPDAFMIVTNATEIYGQGYKSFFSEKF
ncbi:MAG: YitT family protein [Lachnospiraceae bacterium]|nr:YitT family protein [Lachnospiraceae bacterium]